MFAGMIPGPKFVGVVSFCAVMFVLIVSYGVGYKRGAAYIEEKNRPTALFATCVANHSNPPDAESIEKCGKLVTMLRDAREQLDALSTKVK